MGLIQQIKCLLGKHKWRMRIDYKVYNDPTKDKQIGSKVWCKYCGKEK